MGILCLIVSSVYVCLYEMCIYIYIYFSMRACVFLNQLSLRVCLPVCTLCLCVYVYILINLVYVCVCVCVCALVNPLCLLGPFSMYSSCSLQNPIYSTFPKSRKYTCSMLNWKWMTTVNIVTTYHSNCLKLNTIWVLISLRIVRIL